MAKGKSTWKYNKLLTARRNYFDEGGDTKKPNIFQNAWSDTKTAFTNPGAALQSPTMGMTSMLGAAAGAIGDIEGKLISNGLESKAGGIVSGVGDAVGGIPIIGGFAKGALNLIGGGINALFGSKLNKENIAAVEGGVARADSATASAQSFDTLAGQMGAAADISGFDKKFIGKDGLFSNKAGKKFKALREEANRANERQALTMATNAQNITEDTMSNLAANYAAFGGPLGFTGGAIDYGFMTDYLNTKRLQAEGQDGSMAALPNSFAEGGGIHIKPSKRGTFTAAATRHGMGVQEFARKVLANKEDYSPAMVKKANFARNAAKWKHAFGGELNTHGGDFTNGLLAIGNGGSHEENPFEGVPMGVDEEGTPNLVEEGETIFNDYVFSKRLMVPKAIREKYKLRGTKDLSFAEASKQLAKESEERPNDPISERGLAAGMEMLMMEQERVRTKKRGSKTFDKGGRLGKVYAGEEGGSGWLDSTDLRYVPAFASGLMSITDALGITNKPDYSEAESVLEAAKASSTYDPISFNPIGNYLIYKPFDRDFYINKLNAESGATRRAVMQNAGLNRGAGMAAILAADANAQNSLGQLARQAEEYNLAQRQQVEDFNRATNITNSEGALKADQANLEAQLQSGTSYLKGVTAAAELRQKERQTSAAARSAHLSNFINSIGDIGRENFARNMIVSDPSKYYTIDSSGNVHYRNSYYDLTDEQQDQVDGYIARRRNKTKARGGYLTIKRKR